MNARKNTTDQERHASFLCFTAELELLSVKYGIAISACGGVTFGDFLGVDYGTDHTSGDLNCSIDWKGLQAGDQVMVDRSITTDPYKRAGQTGEITLVEDDTVTVLFPDGKTGLYLESTLHIQ